MRHRSRLQISDLGTSQSVFEQAITLEEAEKIVGGKGNAYKKKDSNDCIIEPIPEPIPLIPPPPPPPC